MLADVGGELQFVAASQEAAEMLEIFQIQNREGPCLEAFLTGTPVASADLTQETVRWPSFAPQPRPPASARCRRCRCGCGTTPSAHSTCSL